jgi:hypothetical protein
VGCPAGSVLSYKLVGKNACKGQGGCYCMVLFVLFWVYKVCTLAVYRNTYQLINKACRTNLSSIYR